MERIVLELEARPWLPSNSVRMIRELNYYDMPTEGILRHRFLPRYYFFACIDGAVNEYSMWVYVSISRSEARQLKKLHGNALRHFEAGLLVNRPVDAVMAHEDRGIVQKGQAKIVVEGPLPASEPTLAQEAWSSVNKQIRAEAGAIERMVPC
ncbi:hypothetical protein KJK29_20710 [Streptomyces koelreuteriae]|uniref:NusG-like N-terminal domain-containing protein n=2 Tax=Streptomyces TaxID=1883 RepID=A0ABX8FUR3_9ACTN|nr:hypothetical protein [Streptomyces koelreuteriae]QWB24804.1 hypothetical protein KJK29_20710 [Streptomyces koelreuteriae]UUA07821.1 hypothetical protein NNW98_20825 [Streptomyces koelreuteriae]